MVAIVIRVGFKIPLSAYRYCAVVVGIFRGTLAGIWGHTKALVLTGLLADRDAAVFS
jgi:hypothetical protein